MEAGRSVLSVDYQRSIKQAQQRQRQEDSYEADSLARGHSAGGVKIQEEWQGYLYPHFSQSAGGGLKGYHGLWRFYKPMGVHSVCLEQEFHCIRTYEAITLPEGGSKMLFQNFHDGSASFGSSCSSQRAIDGLFVDSFTRDLTDPYFNCQVMKLEPIEEAEGLPPCYFRRSVPIRSINRPPGVQCAVRLAPALPQGRDASVMELEDDGSCSPVTVTRTPDSTPHPAGASRLETPDAGIVGPTTWGFEAFLQDGDNRWSLGPMYDMSSRELRAHFYIREYVTPLNPYEAIDLVTQPWKTARKSLNGAPSLWMDSGTWVGSMTDIIWDEDGELIRLEPRPAMWTPPDPLRGSHRLYIYDDLMYAYYPAKKLPVVDPQAKATFRNGIRFEVGGFMRTESAFRRIVLRYSINGGVEALTEEVYRPPGARGVDNGREGPHQLGVVVPSEKALTGK